jgi:3-(3-hydroxy-phenyl)propionate hydroxylase
VEDVDGALTGWFEGRTGVAVVRPDRYLAALTTAEGLNDVVGRLRTMLGRSA